MTHPNPAFKTAVKSTFSKIRIFKDAPALRPRLTCLTLLIGVFASSLHGCGKMSDGCILKPEMRRGLYEQVAHKEDDGEGKDVAGWKRLLQFEKTMT
ncbi:hypothetical protein L596_012356 [Steinernema carpocapsae]|uniref:Uncharacterized protein n=1 Tax=Steinernema carpocapsae TaxID=34508 RepID=A0A4U5NWX7_STECR|nr:hypothetical protein L596_012356 [Steinernema carpocapsae]